MLKRIFDLFFTILGIILVSPVLLVCVLLVRLDSAGPVFFRQKRVGLNGKIFEILKFRTMTVNAEAQGPKITVSNDARITRSGAFLRKYKLDELPQLINVLKGDMSLVGPRPEVPEYVAYWPDDSRELILSVCPGITDFASIEFRNENEMLAYAEDPNRTYIEEILPIKLKYYKKYVHERTLWLDIMLIFRTIKIII